MNRFVTALALAALTFGFAQAEEGKACCKDKSAACCKEGKECKAGKGSAKHGKECAMDAKEGAKHGKDCTMDAKECPHAKAHGAAKEKPKT